MFHLLSLIRPEHHELPDMGGHLDRFGDYATNLEFAKARKLQRNLLTRKFKSIPGLPTAA
ncbi:hypothetical protein T265_10790 [Opisthorchis viverrini]|uniref:Uncharacterized protein n=1 Tax=Opisthorchis viverrini TaxID=6198 RepID=A0A074Z5D6_OPIVI|nr:hypothetical protein T265_10789 [Opisthorchis viverrini]XP_009175524.1 hypothetical protein T265_10790 [Opisthorchis viverrini]KER20736.1 hypothetical protein T265_10789 [Opisthorchis viverrini]KER20737.1 hypothetical protein T265_10790 [Opisthorchis viverrini]